mmetsp:Transcript_54382/g.138148  ORF Transcript_54382/g.138148 Transcript_54382/m.138148 type:complete len:245 (+) Transcript_54382:371-1105(+)
MGLIVRLMGANALKFNTLVLGLIACSTFIAVVTVPVNPDFNALLFAQVALSTTAAAAAAATAAVATVTDATVAAENSESLGNVANVLGHRILLNASVDDVTTTAISEPAPQQNRVADKFLLASADCGTVCADILLRSDNAFFQELITGAIAVLYVTTTGIINVCSMFVWIIAVLHVTMTGIIINVCSNFVCVTVLQIGCAIKEIAEFQNCPSIYKINGPTQRLLLNHTLIVGIATLNAITCHRR